MCTAFCTRQYTHGAQLQRPRKTPIRVEPKTWFSNERTFLAWAGMAVLLGTASTVISSAQPASGNLGPFRAETIDVISLTLAPLSAIVLCYGLFTYQHRMSFLEKKEVGFFDDRLGAVSIAGLIATILTGITGVAYYDFFTNR